MGYVGIFFVALFVVLFVLGIVAYVKKWFWFQNSKTTSRKYSEVKDTTGTKSESGKCSGTDGTTTKASKSSECAAACDAAPSTAPCNGYDWDDTTCTLYATAPSSSTYTKGAKDKCYALSK
jgi:hypothetical protein